MPDYLYTQFENEFAKEKIEATELPLSITNNLKYEIRAYQTEAFKRFILLHEDNTLKKKKPSPYHILFNMATGSGKTLIMAGLILYLYEKGYRNFIFFVNTTNIIRKTKDNFLNIEASKYLFNNNIFIDDKEIFFKETGNFDGSDSENINIKFTTIQQLHLDLTSTKENSITYEDFADKKIVLIADEAHHLNAETRSQILTPDNASWESTVLKILNQNLQENILLEFTATIDTDNVNIRYKYMDKIIYKYDLANYREDKYSKEIDIVRSDYGEKERILQALLLSLYRQEIASDYNIDLKPVILFKAKKTIKESEENKEKFHRQIETMSRHEIENIRKTSKVSIVQKSLTYFEKKGINDEDIVRYLQFAFKEENTLSANNEEEADKNQILLNTLEDKDNPIRAIFAVQKLNEGWDVLNLFDIVRLYTERDGGHNRIGPRTIAEAQLIGRGARYCPFDFSPTFMGGAGGGNTKYQRKFDEDISSDLRVLEQLYYHTIEDSRYISDLKNALKKTGIYKDNQVTRQLLLKESFKETEFYQSGYVYYNDRKPKIKDDKSKLKSFLELNVEKSNIPYQLTSGFGYVSSVFNQDNRISTDDLQTQRSIRLSKIPPHVIKSALLNNPFFNFDNISRYVQDISSTSDFNKKYLSNLEIPFRGTAKRLEKISHPDLYNAVCFLLSEIEKELTSHFAEYIAGEFKCEHIKHIFKDKEINVDQYTERAKGQEEFITDKDWYVFNANYGTTEEKKFVEFFDREYDEMQKYFEKIYLIRNERQLKIFDENGKAFEPDFLLFCIDLEGKNAIFQIFIEPKGEHLIMYDEWKNDFLKELEKNKRVFPAVNNEKIKYTITAVPFYSSKDENAFKKRLYEIIDN